MLEYISIHLPKTGGTSFAQFLSENFGDDYFHYKRLNVPKPILEEGLEDISEYIPTNKRIIHGHFKYSQIKKIHEQSNARIIFWMRHPVHRIISQYYFIQRNITIDKKHHFKESIGEISLMEFAHDPRFINLYSKWLDGLDFDNLFFTGTLENFDQDLELLAEKMGFGVEKVYKENTNFEYKNKHNVSEEDMETIARLNDKDIALYERITGKKSRTFNPKKKVQFDNICLASFPRSGNTFFRNLFYEVYGLESGSYDYPTDDKLVFDTYNVIKTHLQPGELPANVLAQTKKILLIRDGRDSLVSNAHHRKDIIEPGSNFEQNLEEAIMAQEGSYFGGWSKNANDWISHADVIIRYEDLVKDTRSVLERLSKMLNLPKPDFDKIPTFESLKFGNPKYGPRKKAKDKAQKETFKQKFFRKGTAGGWKNEFPPSLLNLFWKTHFNTMLKFGYRPDGEIHSVSPYLYPEIHSKLIRLDDDITPKIKVLFVLQNINSLSDSHRSFVFKLIDTIKIRLSQKNSPLEIEIAIENKKIDISEFSAAAVHEVKPAKTSIFERWYKAIFSSQAKWPDKYHVIQYFSSFTRTLSPAKGSKVFSIGLPVDHLQPDEIGLCYACYFKNNDLQGKRLYLPGFVINPCYKAETNNDVIHPVLQKFAIDGSVPFFYFNLTSEDDAEIAHVLEICRELRSKFQFNQLRLVVRHDKSNTKFRTEVENFAGLLVQNPTPEEDALIVAAARASIFSAETIVNGINILSAAACERPVVICTRTYRISPENQKFPFDNILVQDNAKLLKHCEMLMYDEGFLNQEIEKATYIAFTHGPQLTTNLLFEHYLQTK